MSERVPKFRLIDRDGKIVGYEKWYSGAWDKGKRYYVANPLWLYSKDGEFWCPTFIPHSSKEQFTGLHDKNGKEVYEGDRLKCAQPEEEHYDIGEVVYGKSNGAYCLYLPNVGSGIRVPLLNYISGSMCAASESDWEIIGNVHEEAE